MFFIAFGDPRKEVITNSKKKLSLAGLKQELRSQKPDVRCQFFLSSVFCILSSVFFILLWCVAKTWLS